MTRFVTGGAGFIGANFLFYLRERYPDDRLVCIDKLTYAGNLSTLAPLLGQPNFRFAKVDICDREAVYALFAEERPDVVINFAAESHVDRSIADPSLFLQTNINGTSVLMDACREYGNIRFHQVSTDEVYGDLPLDRPELLFTEQTPLHTSSPYSSSKAAVCHFTHCMAVELGKYNIRVNAIAPGFFNTELSKFIPADQFAYINNQMPLGRFGEPIEVGALAVFLASPAAAQITGTVQVIDGGYILSC